MRKEITLKQNQCNTVARSKQTNLSTQQRNRHINNTLSVKENMYLSHNNFEMKL